MENMTREELRKQIDTMLTSDKFTLAKGRKLIKLITELEGKTVQQLVLMGELKRGVQQRIYKEGGPRLI